MAGCRTARARLTQGADRGKTTTLLIAGTTGFGSVAAGDRIRVFKTPAPPPGVVAAHVAPYSFADYDRRVLIASMPITTASSARRTRTPTDRFGHGRGQSRRAATA